jgi:hypothetical protein
MRNLVAQYRGEGINVAAKVDDATEDEDVAVWRDKGIRCP